jgi:hypothetical protein
LIITGRPTACAATAAGVHGLVVSSWAVKAVCRSVYCCVLADGTALAFTFAELVLIITGRPTADAATAAGVHGLVVSSWAVKAVCRSEYCRVLADGTAAAFVKVQRGLELALGARALQQALLFFGVLHQVIADERGHGARGSGNTCFV